MLLTTDAAIRKLNRQFRGKNKATDVLSFPAEGIGAEEIAGDLAISVTTARRQAVEQGHSLSTEIKVLILHGLLHLAGYDHETDDGQMARRERLLRGKLGLPQGLIERADSDKPQSDRRAVTQASQSVCKGATAMSPLAIAMVVLLAAVETLASYISRVYSEFGKILTREIEENLDAWEELVEPQLGLSREHAAISAAVLQQLALGIIALEFGAMLFDRAPHLARPPTPRLRRRFLAWCWW